jgi:hypothetical protein
MKKAGGVVISNDAARTGGKAVVVRAYTRHQPATFPRDERGVLVLQWSRPGVGFGEITLTARGGKLAADTEAMSDEFVLDVVRQALQERHK